MNIMFTKKITAFILALILIIGVAMPSFAAYNSNNMFSKADIEKVLKSGGLDNDVKDALETVLEAMEKGIEIERGRRIYDEDGNLIDVSLEAKFVNVTRLVITDTDMLLKIEYDSKEGYINISEEANEEEAEEVEKAEQERLAKEQAEKEEAERLAKEQAEKEEAERLAKEQAEKEEQERLAKEQAEKEEQEKTKEQEDVEVVILNEDDEEKEISEEVEEQKEEETSEEVEKKEDKEETPSILEKLKGASGLFNKLLPIIQNIMQVIAQALRKRLNQFFKLLM